MMPRPVAAAAARQSSAPPPQEKYTVKKTIKEIQWGRGKTEGLGRQGNTSEAQNFFYVVYFGSYHPPLSPQAETDDNNYPLPSLCLTASVKQVNSCLHSQGDGWTQIIAWPSSL